MKTVLLNRCIEAHKITLWLNVFIVLKVKFSVTYCVVFTVSVSWNETTRLCMADAKLHYFFLAEKTIPSAVVNWPLFWLPRESPQQLVLCFKHFAKSVADVVQHCYSDDCVACILLQFRRHVRPLFQSGERLAFVYDVLTFLVTRVTVAYLTVPFALLEFWSSFEFYKYVTHFCRATVAFLWQLVLLIFVLFYFLRKDEGDYVRRYLAYEVEGAWLDLAVALTRLGRQSLRMRCPVDLSQNVMDALSRWRPKNPYSALVKKMQKCSRIHTWIRITNS